VASQHETWIVLLWVTSSGFTYAIEAKHLSGISVLVHLAAIAACVLHGFALCVGAYMYVCEDACVNACACVSVCVLACVCVYM